LPNAFSVFSAFLRTLCVNVLAFFCAFAVLVVVAFATAGSI
jgi:disulfide bond formation protein DsbB